LQKNKSNSLYATIPEILVFKTQITTNEVTLPSSDIYHEDKVHFYVFWRDAFFSSAQLWQDDHKIHPRRKLGHALNPRCPRCL